MFPRVQREIDRDMEKIRQLGKPPKKSAEESPVKKKRKH